MRDLPRLRDTEAISRDNTVAELRSVVCAGSQTNKPLLGSADDRSRRGKIDPNKSGK
jgi:hypothetical protein